MPTIKVKRQDILRRAEIEETLSEMRPDMKALIALLWIFGKRVSEVLMVRRGEIYTANEYLNVRFHVLKKRSKSNDTYLKRITLKHPAVKYVLHYINDLPPDTTEETLLFMNLTRQLANYYLKKANSRAYLHLFRKSLATEFSERGYTVQQLMAWFDWTEPRIAIQYVNRGTGLTKEMSDRTF